MTREQALEIVLEAAERWAEEIRAYIEPAEPGPDYRWDERAHQIEQAIMIVKGRRMTDYRLGDKQAMNRIHRILDKTEWSADTIEHVAEVVVSTGRKINPPKPSTPGVGR